MTCSRRRGACPSLRDPMPTGDGLLARLSIRDTVPLDTFAELCASAQRHGNGVVEITARGSLQIRGLGPQSKDAFAAEVLALGIDVETGVPVAINPLAGLEDEPDMRGLVGELRRALDASPFTARLGPKISVVVDGGGGLHLDALTADVRLRFGGPWFHIAVGGDHHTATAIGRVPVACGDDAAMRLLAVIAARGARARKIVLTEGTAPFRNAVAGLLVDAPPPPARAPAEPLGIHVLRDGQAALGIALPFGHADAGLLESLIGETRRVGATGLRLAPGRALLAIGLRPERAIALAGVAQTLGLIVRTDDARRYIAACPGAPRCASATLATRDLAPSIAAAAAALLDGSFVLHLSGCPKGCAHHGRTALTVVGTGTAGEAAAREAAGMVIDGSPRDTPAWTVGAAAVPAALARLAREIERERRPGEPASGVLSRLGAPLMAGAEAVGHG